MRSTTSSFFGNCERNKIGHRAKKQNIEISEKTGNSLIEKIIESKANKHVINPTKRTNDAINAKSKL